MNQTFYSTIRLAAFALTLTLAAGACTKDDAEGTAPTQNGVTADETIEGNYVMTVRPDKKRVLRNPLNGWVCYAGIGSGLSDTFWEQYDNFDAQNGTVKVSDYANTLYIRGAWSDFNPEEGKYAWNADCNTKPAQRLKMLIEGAAARNMLLAFTFIVDSQDKAYDFTPAYVKAAGTTGYITQTGSKTVWSPYPQDPIFQAKYEIFLKAFAAEFNDPSRVAFISGFGLGKWGETHTFIYDQTSSAANYAAEAIYRTPVFEWVSDLYVKTFDKLPVVINYHRCIGSVKATSTSSADLAASQALIESAIAKGFSLRSDAFGMKSYYSTFERSIAKKWNFQRPIIMEGGWVKTSHGSSIKGDGYADFAAVRKGEFDEAKGALVNMMDLRYSSDIKNGETWSWFNEGFSLMQQFIAEGGYRLYPDRLSLPAEVRNGAKIKIAHRWSNLGWGYCPTNIPQWKGRFKVAFALLDAQNYAPKYLFVDDKPEPSQWIRGSAKSYTFEPTISGVEGGKYIWAVALVDTGVQSLTSKKKVGIQLATRQSEVTPAGWLKLFEVQVL